MNVLLDAPHALPQDVGASAASTSVSDPSANEFLMRIPLAEKLRKVGFPITAKTLATMATRGGGPPYYKFGPRVLYRWSDALRWAQNRLSAARASTSEAFSSVE